MFSSIRLLILLIVTAASSAWLNAQNVVLTGVISGRVTDASGAIVPGASVIVRNLGTGVQQSAVSNRAGLYQFPALMSGTYSVTATSKGFQDVQVLTRVMVGNKPCRTSGFR